MITDANAAMFMEDEHAQTLRIDQKLRRELAKFNRLSSLATECKLIMAEDQEISNQLALSKSLVTEMLEFISAKSHANTSNGELTQKIADLQEQLVKVIQQVEMFSRAAYYD